MVSRKKVYCDNCNSSGLLKLGSVTLSTLLFIGVIANLNAFGQTDHGAQEDSIDKIELIKNGNFVAGLDNWRAKVFQAGCRSEGDRDCFPQQFDEFPKSSVSDTQSPGQRYFVTVVPSKSDIGWFNLIGALVSASVLEQDVDIPNAKSAVLSFKARGYSDTQLEIYAKNRDDSTKTLINQLTLNDKRYSLGDIVQRTYDMTAFSGKKITLMFVSKQISVPPLGGEDLNTAVYLYNISFVAEVPKLAQTTYLGTDPNLLVYGISAVVIIGVLAVAFFVKKSKRTSYREEPTTVSSKQSTVQEKSEQQKSILKANKSVSEKDDSIIKTGGTLTDIKESSQEEIEPDYTDADYRKLIDDEMDLKILWALYMEPRKYHNRNQLYVSFKEESDRSKKFNKSMEDLIDRGLVQKMGGKKFTNETKETFTPDLTYLGKELIKKARGRKITKWGVFLDEFKDELGSEPE